MFPKNILLYQKSKLIKIIYILLIITILTSLILNLMCKTVSAAQYQEKYGKSNKINNYPGYSDLIEKLKKEHPNWNFTIFYTGLNWNQVIKNETTAQHGRNLIDGSKTGEWVCSTCKEDKYDNGSWKCASEATVAYYMDPRNSLNEDYIFQFEDLTYNEEIHTIDGVEKILADCKYMQGTTITYTKTNGKTGTIEKSYAQVIMDAAKEYNISPYHIAARVRQEQGPGNSASSTATGTYSGYKGYYNFFNIEATGSGSTEIITNALKHAKSEGWTDPEKSIHGGAEFIASEYIAYGQTTLYLQKFDVDNSDGDMYWHQYMQNVSASKTESTEVKATYQELNMLDASLNFIIPVYEGMPTEKCAIPGSTSIVTQNIKVTDSQVVVRKTQSTSATKLATLTKGTTLLRIEIGKEKVNGYLWDKVVLANGTKGYIISSGIVQVSDITNCNKKAIANEYGNLRNGPGTSGTTVLITLSMGQAVTIIEEGKYNNLDGYNWSRVELSDGMQGYIVSSYLSEVNDSADSAGNELVKVVCSSLIVREEPGTSSKVLTYLDNGDVVTRTQKSVSEKNGYIWDKVVTGSGIEGYVARGDSSELYIDVVSETSIRGTGFKSDGTKLVCDPTITVANIKKVCTDAVIKNGSKTISSGNVGTGYTITTGGKTYTIIKMGDTNGDGKLTPADSTVVLRGYVGSIKLSANAKSAADANKDGKLTPADSTVILRTYVGLANIKI